MFLTQHPFFLLSWFPLNRFHYSPPPRQIRSWAQSRRLSDALLKRLKVYVTAEFDQVGEFNETDLLKTMYPSLRIDLMHHILGTAFIR